ncbi:MAG: hypothetical protein H2212_02410 [Ruminococcus sp.]|nr:hypothetical protein [Ruminococcus sp.]
MNLYNSIFQRKSSRKYVMQPLPQQLLIDMENSIKGFEQLYPNLPLEYRFAKKTKGMFSAKAPHFLIISGQGRPGELESAGFLFQQLVLWMDAKEIGSVWLGSAKDTESSGSKKDIITLAFGQSTEEVHRVKNSFNRKPITEITNSPDDACIQAAHLAPSGMNTQPWYFEKTSDNVLLYQRNLKPPLSLIYKLADLDMGIALCHYALACKEIDKPFSFTRTTDNVAKSGFNPFGVID